MSRRTLLRDFMLANPLYAGGSVEFFEADASGNKTTTKAVLFDNESGVTLEDQLTNPQTLDSEGKLPQPVYFEERMIGVVSGLVVPGHDTGVIHTSGSFRGQWATATLYYPGDTVIAGAAADSTNDIYIIDALHTSGTFATDVSNGELSQMIDIDSLVGLNDVPVIGGGDAGKLIQVNATSDGYEIVSTLTGDIIFSGALTLSQKIVGVLATARNELATLANIQDNITTYAAASGTDTYTVTYTPAITALITGKVYYAYFANSNTSTTPTLNPNTIGAKTIVNIAGGALLYGEIDGYHELQYDGTNFRLLNPAKPRFRGALVSLSVPQSINNASNTIINFNTETYDTDSIHDNVTNNSRLTVPAGVTKIRLSFNLTFLFHATGTRMGRILKDGAGSGSVPGYPFTHQSAASGSAFGHIVTATGQVIDVTAGEYFELQVYQNSTASLDFSSASWFAMEIIE